MDGAQWIGINIANEVKGLQLGAINYTVKLDGLQIGVINIAWGKDSIWKVLPIVNANW